MKFFTYEMTLECQSTRDNPRITSISDQMPILISNSMTRMAKSTTYYWICTFVCCSYVTVQALIFISPFLCLL